MTELVSCITEKNAATSRIHLADLAQVFDLSGEHPARVVFYRRDPNDSRSPSRVCFRLESGEAKGERIWTTLFPGRQVQSLLRALETELRPDGDLDGLDLVGPLVRVTVVADKSRGGEDEFEDNFTVVKIAKAASIA